MATSSRWPRSLSWSSTDPCETTYPPVPTRTPLSQALRYLKRVRAGEVQTASGRQILNPERIPGYCYVITDLTPTVKERCIDYSLRLMPDGLGYFGYNTELLAQIEVVSFDRLLTQATRRNRAFFDKLGLPAT